MTSSRISVIELLFLDYSESLPEESFPLDDDPPLELFHCSYRVGVKFLRASLAATFFTIFLLLP